MDKALKGIFNGILKFEKCVIHQKLLQVKDKKLNSKSFRGKIGG